MPAGGELHLSHMPQGFYSRLLEVFYPQTRAFPADIRDLRFGFKSCSVPAECLSHGEKLTQEVNKLILSLPLLSDLVQFLSQEPPKINQFY